MKQWCIFLSFALITLSLPVTRAWSPQTNLQISYDAIQLMPSSIKMLLNRNFKDLIEGLTDGMAYVDKNNNLPVVVEKESKKISDMINDHKPFSQVINRFGFIAQLVIRNNDPFSLHTVSQSESQLITPYNQFVERNLKNFPLIFKGYSPLAHDFSYLQQLPVASAQRSQDILPTLLEACRDRIKTDPHLNFDTLSIPFGLISINYSNAVSDVAHAWFVIWYKSNGDLSGMPCEPPEFTNQQ